MTGQDSLHLVRFLPSTGVGAVAYLDLALT